DQILAEHPEALDRFVDMAMLRADLDQALSGRAVPLPLPRRRRAPWAMAAAAVLGIAALIFVSMRARREDDGPSFEGCAVLAHAVDPKWEGASPVAGSVLPKGRLV